MWELFHVNFNANLKVFLRSSNYASVGEKTLIIKVDLKETIFSFVEWIYPLKMEFRGMYLRKR
jgi:hypothetical protein